MNDYERRQEARKARLEGLASQAKAEGNALYTRAKTMAAAIPFGQPVLVGHHSEQRDRSYRGRIHSTFGRAFAAQDKATHYASKAQRVGTGGISGDDPEALAKLRAELASLDAAQERMKAANRAIRRKAEHAATLAALVSIGFEEAQAGQLLTKDYMGRVGFPSYALQNNRANAARLRDRIAEIEAMRKREEVEVECDGFTYREDLQDNRVKFFFPAKPDQSTRDLLRRFGFKWSPSREGQPWVRQMTTAAIQAGALLRAELDKLNTNQ